MKAFSFFSGSAKKKENKRSPVSRSTSSPDLLPTLLGEDASSPAKPSLERMGAGGRNSIHDPRIFGKRAFSRSTSRLGASSMSTRGDVLPVIPTKEARRPSIFCRPRFAVFRDSSPRQDHPVRQGPNRPIVTQRSLSLGVQEAPSPDFIQAMASSTIAIPPMPPLPQNLPSTVRPQGSSGSPLSYPPSAKELPPVPSSSLAGTRGMPRDTGHIEGLRRRTKSFADKETMLRSKKSMPELDSVWRGFLQEADDEIVTLMPPVPRFHSCDVDPTTRKARTLVSPPRTLPTLPLRSSKKTPGIIASSGPLTAPASQPEDPDSTTSTRRTVNFPIIPSRQAMLHLSPSVPSGLSAPFHPKSPRWHRTSMALPQSDSARANILLDPSPCSSEISLSLFPVPPISTLTYADGHTERITHEVQPRPGELRDHIPLPLSIRRTSLDDSDGESVASPVNSKFPSLFKSVQLKGPSSRDSGSTITTEEWSELSASLSSFIGHSEPRNPWRDAPSGPQANTFEFHEGGFAIRGKDLVSSDM